MSNIGGDGIEIENGKQKLGIRSMLSNEVPYDEWVPLHVAGQRPSALYQHAAEVINEKLFVIGGSCRGRYLSDIQIKWNDVLFVVAGNPKDSFDTVSVWSIDPTTDNCVAVKTFGKIPIARGGQSVTLVGSKLIMFGGEGNRRKVLNDIHILDLETMSWVAIETRWIGPKHRWKVMLLILELVMPALLSMESCT